MFEKGDLVKYSNDYLVEETDGMEKLYAATWRGIILEESGDDIYCVADRDFPDDVADISGDILVLTQD